MPLTRIAYDGTAGQSTAPKKRVNAGQTALGLVRKVGGAIKGAVDNDKNGKISLGEVADAGKKVAQGAISGTKKLADMTSYAINENTWRKQLDKGEIDFKTYKTMTDDAANTAGINIKDKGGTIARKVAGAGVESATELVPALKAGKLAVGGTKLAVGASKATKALKVTKELTKDAVKYGTAQGVGANLQRDKPGGAGLAADVAMGVGGAAAGNVVGYAGGKVVKKAVEKAAARGINNSTRVNLLQSAAGEPKPSTPGKVAVPLSEQKLDPAKGGVSLTQPKSKDGHPIDTKTGEVMEPQKPITDVIAELEDTLKNHPKSPALAVDTARRIARDKGMDNHQYAELLKVTLDTAENQAKFSDSANQVRLKTEAEAAAPEANKPAESAAPKQEEVSLLDQNAKNAQETTIAKQQDAAIRGGGLNPIEMPGMDKYRQRAAAYKEEKTAENAMLDQKYEPSAAEIAAADRNAVAPEPVSLVKPNDTKPEVSLVSEPKVQLEQPQTVADLPKANNLDEVVAQRDTVVNASDKSISSIADAARSLGKTPEQLFDMIDSGNVPKKFQAIHDLHNKLLDDLRTYSEASYGKIENYVPHQNPDAPKLEANDLFDSTFDFAKHRSGELKDYSHDYEAVMHNLAVQAADAKARLYKQAADQGVTVQKILDDRKVAQDLADAAKKDQLGQVGIVDRLYQNDVAEAKRLGEPIPERAIVTDKVSGFTRWARDGWTGLKQSGVWNDVFEPLARASERANYKFETLVRPALDSLDDTLVALQKAGITEPERLAAIGRDLSKIKDGAVEGYLNRLLYSKEKSDGQQILTDWLRSHEITDPTLKGLVNTHAEKMLARDAIVPDFARKFTNFVTGRVYKAALGLNVRSTMNQLFEGKRTLSREGVFRGSKFLAEAAGSNDYRKKYGVDVSIEDQLNIIRNKDLKLWGALKKLDDAQMFFFMKGEAYKNEVMLRAGEAAGRKKGLEGDDLFKHTMDYFEKYAHVYGQFGTVGAFDKNFVKLLGQFGQYAIKDLSLTGDMALRAVGKGDKVDLTTQGDAIKYLLRLGAINTGLFTVMSAAIGATWQEVFGGPMLNGGPLVTLAQDLWQGVQTELANAQEEERGFDANKAVNRAGKRAIAGTTIPSGNQLINKTGVQALLPDDNPVKQTFQDGALMDMERGYNQAAGGGARFLAPQTGEEQAKALTFGPYSTKNSQDYFNKGGQALSTKQTEQLNAAPDIQGEFTKIQTERGERKAAKQEAEARKAAGLSDPPKIKRAKLKVKKAKRIRIRAAGGKVHKPKRMKIAKAKKIKLGIKT